MVNFWVYLLICWENYIFLLSFLIMWVSVLRRFSQHWLLNFQFPFIISDVFNNNLIFPLSSQGSLQRHFAKVKKKSTTSMFSTFFMSFVFFVFTGSKTMDRVFLMHWVFFCFYFCSEASVFYYSFDFFEINKWIVCSLSVFCFSV